jgi:hypothetical protein
VVHSFDPFKDIQRPKIGHVFKKKRMVKFNFKLINIWRQWDSCRFHFYFFTFFPLTLKPSSLPLSSSASATNNHWHHRRPIGPTGTSIGRQVRHPPSTTGTIEWNLATRTSAQYHSTPPPATEVTFLKNKIWLLTNHVCEQCATKY